jgi:hypothetical protein
MDTLLPPKLFEIHLFTFNEQLLTWVIDTISVKSILRDHHYHQWDEKSTLFGARHRVPRRSELLILSGISENDKCMFEVKCSGNYQYQIFEVVNDS